MACDNCRHPSGYVRTMISALTPKCLCKDRHLHYVQMPNKATPQHHNYTGHDDDVSSDVSRLNDLVGTLFGGSAGLVSADAGFSGGGGDFGGGGSESSYSDTSSSSSSSSGGE